MNAPASFTNQFYITRHSANLMEDLQRQIQAGGSISLIYGAQGSGKTRLIKQFVASRLFDRDITFCSMTHAGFSLNNDHQLHDYKNFQTILQEQITEASIFIVDQLEQAPDFIIQQLFQFWANSTGVLNASLILLCRAQSLQIVHEISKQFNLEVFSVELKPFSYKESVEYLSAQLCPKAETLPVFNSEINRQLKIAGGMPALLDQIIQQHAGLVQCQRHITKSQKVRFLIFFLLLSFCLIIVFKSNQFGFSSHVMTQTEVPDIQSDPDRELIKIESTDLLVEPRSNDIDSSLAPVPDLTKTIPEPSDLKKAETSSQPTKDNDVMQLEEPMVAKLNLYQQRLSATHQWLKNSSDLTSTIQIMSLSSGINTEQSLIDFLNQSANLGVDLQQIYIYRVHKPARNIYVVLYGNYPSKSKATLQIDSLPASFRANSPIVRTVSGIKKEIDKDLY